METLLKRIQNKEAIIGIVGLGYVGLPLAMEFCKGGFTVIGVDLLEDKIEQLKSGKSYVLDVAPDTVAEYVGKTFFPTSSYSELAKADTISIAVPTPLRKSKDPDISYIVSAMEQIKKVLHKNMVIVLESTTYPGTTKELIAAEVENMGYALDKDFFIAFSPERVDPGNPVYHTKNTPKVIGGCGPNSTLIAKTLYEQVIDTVVPVDSTEEAEMVKLLENTFRAVNIGLVNELTLMCDRMGVNIWNVIDAAATKPFGFMPFYPGPGIGGHCIPLDPMYLSWKAKMFNFYNKFIELATDINGNMPRFVIEKLMHILNNEGKALSKSKILLLGMAYKNDIDDLRESPGLEIYNLLLEKNANIEFYDPYVSSFQNGAERVSGIAELTPAKIAEYDCVVLLTAHKNLDYELIAEHSKLIFDTRNGFKGIDSKKIKRL